MRSEEMYGMGPCDWLVLHSWEVLPRQVLNRLEINTDMTDSGSWLGRQITDWIRVVINRIKTCDQKQTDYIIYIYTIQ